MPVISIIIPVFRVEDYLPATLDSVTAQTYGDWECILIDDGSPDRSGEICDLYAERDARFRVLHLPNRGVSAARNTGIDAAHGEYIAFLDADDRLTPDFLESLLPLMEAGADLAVGEYRRIYPNGEVIPDRADEHIGDYLWDAELPWEDTPAGGRLAASDAVLAELWNSGMLNSVWGKLYRRCLIEDMELEFDTRLTFAEDMRFAAGYARFCSSFGMVEKPLYHYLWREGSLTTAPRPGMLINRFHALTAIAENFAEAGYLNAARAVRDRLDFLTPEGFLERMEDKGERLALLKEYCALENYPRMLAEVKETRSTLTWLVYATRSPRILLWMLGLMLKKRQNQQ